MRRRTLRRAQWRDEKLEAESVGKCLSCTVKTKGYHSLEVVVEMPKDPTLHPGCGCESFERSSWFRGQWYMW